MLKAISLYTGIGGLDFGLEAAGFKTAVALEMDAICCRTIRLNRKWPVIERKIERVASKTILATAQLKPGEADILVGGPPCQPFSKSSYWVNGDSGRLSDPRARTLSSYLRVLRDTRPRTFMIENAPGLAYKAKDEGLRHLMRGIDAINKKVGTNYHVSWRVINAAGFGVPQRRERIFLIGSRDGAEFQFPPYTHQPQVEDDLVGPGGEPFRTAWDALGGVPLNSEEKDLRIGGNWADLLPSIPEGQNYLWHTKRGGGEPLFGWRTKYWSFLLKLSKSQPAWTIQAQPGSACGPFHWDNRKLSALEMCRLQTFPEGLVFDCGRGDLQRMIGNAVPSLVAEVLGLEIRRQLLGERPRKTPLKLLPPRRTKVPPPEEVGKVPPKYLPLIGDHPDHPGEGKGVGAQERRQRQASLFADAAE